MNPTLYDSNRCPQRRHELLMHARNSIPIHVALSKHNQFHARVRLCGLSSTIFQEAQGAQRDAVDTNSQWWWGWVSEGGARWLCSNSVDTPSQRTSCRTRGNNSARRGVHLSQCTISDHLAWQNPRWSTNNPHARAFLCSLCMLDKKNSTCLDKTLHAW